MKSTMSVFCKTAREEGEVKDSWYDGVDVSAVNMFFSFFRNVDGDLVSDIPISDMNISLKKSKVSRGQ